MPTAICPVCHSEYEFTNARTDRCPVCCPKVKPVEVFDNNDLLDEQPDDD